jgi:hypothetical protein
VTDPRALNLSDAAGLRDLADRSLRAAKTARQAIPGTPPPANSLLSELAGHLEAAAVSATAIAAVLEEALDDAR